MSKLFTPTPGLWTVTPIYGGWGLQAGGKPLATIPTLPGVPLWETECNARLARAAPGLLGTLIRQHNYLGLVQDSHDPRAMAVSIQKGMRRGIANALGNDITLSGHAFEDTLIIPEPQ